MTVVDNTFFTPWFQRPLDLGADVAVYSATKYLSGHNDLLAGLLVTKTKELGEKLYFYQNSTGAVPGPWDCWLVLRGLKTLSLRLERQEQNASAIAKWLARQPHVAKVLYPGLETHPGHQSLKSQSSGNGSVVSFEVDDPTLSHGFFLRWRFFCSLKALAASNRSSPSPLPRPTRTWTRMSDVDWG